MSDDESMQADTPFQELLRLTAKMADEEKAKAVQCFLQCSYSSRLFH